jgi:hypothetical protein
MACDLASGRTDRRFLPRSTADRVVTQLVRLQQ